MLGLDVSKHYPCHLVLPFSVCCASLYFAPSYYVPDSLMGLFAQTAPWNLSAVVDPRPNKFGA